MHSDTQLQFIPDSPPYHLLSIPSDSLFSVFQKFFVEISFADVIILVNLFLFNIFTTMLMNLGIERRKISMLYLPI